jgi:hypothetical protein
MTTIQTNPPTVHLQGIGRVRAKAAGELVAGDVIVFNYGYAYTVVKVEQGRGSLLNVHARDEKGKVWEINKRASTLMGYGGKEG